MAEPSNHVSRDRSPRRRWPPVLFLVALACVGVQLLIASVLQARHEESVLTHTEAWVRGRVQAHDSWMPMRQAYERSRRSRGEAIYRSTFFARQIKFQYPPSSLLLFAVADQLHLRLTDHALNRMNWAFVAAQALAVGVLARQQSRAVSWATNSPLCRRTMPVLAAAGCIVYYPVVKAFSLGQIQTALNTAFAVACLAWVMRRRGWAGAAVGLACLVKPQFCLFALWGVIRREWRFVACLIAVALAGWLASVAVFGVENQRDYLGVLRYIGSRGETYYPNNSVNGLTNRLLGNGDALVWQLHEYPPFDRVVYVTTVVTSLVLVAACLLVGRRDQPASGVDFAIAGLTFTLASPVAWEHHFGILPPIFLLLAFALAAKRPGPARSILASVLALAYVASGGLFPFLIRAGVGWRTIPESYLFFAAVATLAVAYAVRRSDARESDAAAVETTVSVTRA